MPCSLLPPALWQSIPFGDRDAFADWLLVHQLWHVTIGRQLPGTAVLTFDDLKVDLLRHADVHDAIDRALNIPGAFDLSSYDLNDRSSYYSFMMTHAQEHAREHALLGL